jgi:hypothetical protein
MAERNAPVVVAVVIGVIVVFGPTVAVEVETVAVLIVIAALRLLAPFIAPLLPALLSPVIAVRVPRGTALLAVARNLPIL